MSVPTMRVAHGDLGAFDQRQSVVLGPVKHPDGTPAFRATVPSGGGSYARGIFELPGVKDGDELWCGVDVLPHASVTLGSWDPIRFDNWPELGNGDERVGIMRWRSDGSTHVLLMDRGSGYYRVNDVNGPVLKEDTWTRLELHVKVGEWTDMHVNGSLVGRTTRPNYFGNPYTRLRFGIVNGPYGGVCDFARCYLGQTWLATDPAPQPPPPPPTVDCSEVEAKLAVALDQVEAQKRLAASAAARADAAEQKIQAARLALG